MSLFGLKITSNKPGVLFPAEDQHLIITQAAIAESQGGDQVLTITIGGDEFTLGTLRKGSKDEIPLNLHLLAGTETTYYMNLKGEGEVHLTGCYQPDAIEEDSDDSLGMDHMEDTDSEEEDFPISAKIEEVKEDSPVVKQKTIKKKNSGKRK